MAIKRKGIKQNNRGLYTKLYEEIKSWEKTGSFNEDNFEHFGKSKTVIRNGLDYIAKNWGVIEPRTPDGFWMTKNAETPKPVPAPRRKRHMDIDVVVLDSLLKAMAEAEPTVRKLIKIQKVLNELR